MKPKRDYGSYRLNRNFSSKGYTTQIERVHLVPKESREKLNSKA